MPSPPQPKFEKYDIITDDDDDDDNGGYKLGDKTLQNNIDRNITFLEEDDLNIDQLDDPQLPTPGKKL